MDKEVNDISSDLKRFSNLAERYIRRNSIVEGNEKITRTQALMLKFIDNKLASGKKVYQKDIEAHFSIRRSTATESLKRLEDNGLITRQVSSEDARLKDIYLTDKARANIERVKAHAKKMATVLKEGITKEELETLRTIIKKMENNIKRQEHIDE